jgi:hypothetical protein
MNPLLTTLGVSPEIQALFGVGEQLTFDYGDSAEHFSSGRQKLPNSRNIRCSGNDTAPQVVVTPGVMDAVAFMTLNIQKFIEPENLLFIAIGNRCNSDRLQWIGSSFKKRKIILVFPNDLTGRLTDIRIATDIRNKPVKFTWSDPFVRFETGTRSFRIDGDLVSLAAFERHAGIRTQMKTIKPFRYNSFLEQLIYDTK